MTVTRPAAPNLRTNVDMEKTPHRHDVIVADPGQLDTLLAEAEASLRLAAMARGTAGILVTRHDLRRYTLSLDDTVPFGETREKSML